LINFTSHSITPGVTLHLAETDKFKTVSFKVCILHPLERNSVTSFSLLPQMLKQGTQKHPSYLDMTRHLEHLFGAGFSADSHKFGETQILDFSMSVPAERFLPQAKGINRQAVDFLMEVIFRPNLDGDGFPEQKVRIEKENLRQRIEGLKDERYQYASQRCIEIMCPDEPFSFFRYGFKEDLESITPTLLYSDYNRAVTDGEYHIFVVGAVDREEILKIINDIPFEARQLKYSVVTPKKTDPVKEVTEEADLAQGVLVMGCRLNVTYGDELYPQALVYNGILGGFAHSKLFVEVREKNSLAYSAYSRYHSLKGILTLHAGIDMKKYLQAKELMLLQLEQIKQAHLQPLEMEMTKNSLISDLMTDQDSASGIISEELMGIIAGRKLRITDLIEKIKEVTPEQVKEVASLVQLDTIYFLKGKE
jgi:predicted Zn-dependent peptidase